MKTPEQPDSGMTYERFKQLWEKYVPKEEVPIEHSPLIDALLQAAEGDFTAFDEADRVIEKRDLEEAASAALTHDEREVINHLADAWNAFIELPRMKESDMGEFKQAIHGAQLLIAARVARRVDPDVWSRSVPYIEPNPQSQKHA